MCGMNNDCFWTKRKSFSTYVYGSRCYTISAYSCGANTMQLQLRGFHS